MNNTKKLPTTGIKPTIESFFAISVCMNNTKKLPTTGIKPTIESFFAISVCHFRDQRECKGIIDE